MEMTRLEESHRISFQVQNGVLVDQPEGVGETAPASFWMTASSSAEAGRRRRKRRVRVEREWKPIWKLRERKRERG